MPSIPSSNKYPEFVPDQLLTSEHLNNLFRYADSEGRATRSRLVGIGIVCGLEVKAGANSITISKGCGITTAGYLVRLDEDTTYTHLKTYDPLTEYTYDRFLNAGGTSGAFPIKELIREASVEGAAALTAASMQGKAVVMFVELYYEGAKNCDPASCDDKGASVTVSYKPLLVDVEAAEKLLGEGLDGEDIPASAAKLPPLRMPRYDVPATPLVNAAAVLNRFRKVLNPSFLKKMEAVLGKTYDVFSPLISGLYPTNPFNGLARDFGDVYDDLDTATMLALQYHYDHFSDLMLAHDELRRVGEKLLAVCCPDERLFPRHLVLGAVSGNGPRHSFHPSAALAGEGKTVSDLRLLFRRLVLLAQRFAVPAPKQSGKKANAVPIRITPSHWGTGSLSQRAIPFYYKVAQPVPALFAHWNSERARTGTSTLTLSYHAADYNNADESVTKPLDYDLEPYNFLRIEGHVGQKMPVALASILKQKAENRLPFEVVALGADLRNVTRLIRSLIQQQRKAITSLTNVSDAAGIRTNLNALSRAAAATLQSAANKAGLLGDCHVQDVEAIYDTLRAEFECALCAEMQYFYDIRGRQQQNSFTNAVGTTAGTAAAQQEFKPIVPLLKKCAPEFRYKAGTLGQMFEALWPALEKVPYKSPDEFLMQLDAALAAASQTGKDNLNKDILGVWLALYLLYYIERLWEILPSSLSVFDVEAFATRYEDLMQIAGAVKELINDDLEEEDGGDEDASELFKTEDAVDHLDALLYTCKGAAFEAVYREFLLRYMRALLRQKFGFFANQHPGIQHKAGVPMGGTFILVYHEAEIELEDEEEEAQNIFAAAQKRVAAFKTFFQAKKAEAVGGVAFDPEKRAANPAPKTEASGGAKGVEAKNLVVNLVKPPATYSAILTEGDAKAMEFFAKYSAALKDEDEKDTALQDLLDELPDGTVIADFCLPYLCCSDCPPMQFVVRSVGEDEEPEPQPEKPTLRIEQKNYCVDDSAEYPIVVTPAGGQLTGEGVNANNATFQPSAIALTGGASKKDVPISYATDGGTDSKTVTVFAKPDASFKANTTPSTPLAFRFEDTSTNAQSWAWTFGDGQTATEQNPQHSYQTRGPFTVTLTVENGPCRDIAQQTVTIGGGNQPQPATCAPLEPNVELLEKLLKDTTTPIAEFMKILGQREALTKLAAILREAVPLSVAEQIKLFLKKQTPSAIAQLLQAVQDVILKGGHSINAFGLYRLLLAVAFYIACIQAVDLDKMRASIAPVLEVLKNHAFVWADVDRQWSAADKTKLNAVRTQIQAERDRANSAGNASKYVEVLDDILNMLNTMSL